MSRSPYPSFVQFLYSGGGAIFKLYIFKKTSMSWGKTTQHSGSLVSAIVVRSTVKPV